MPPFRSSHNLWFTIHKKYGSRQDTVHAFHSRWMFLYREDVCPATGSNVLFQTVVELFFSLASVFSNYFPVKDVFAVNHFLVAGLPVMSPELLHILS